MLFADPTLVSTFKEELDELSMQMARIHARVLVILNQLHRAGVAGRDGARSMADWTATTLDITHAAALQLVNAANRLYRTDPFLFEELEKGNITFDRAMETLRLECTDAPYRVVDKSLDLDLTAVNRLIHQYRRLTRKR